MATLRKRPSSGFSSESIEELPTPPDPEPEQESTSLTVDQEVVQDEHVEIFREVVITPTEDPGPRFVELKETPKEEVKAQPILLNKPKRHPRNIPKFSTWS